MEENQLKEKSVVVQVREQRNMAVAYLLWFLLGGIGAHRFYLGKPGTAVGMIALNFFGWLTAGIVVGFFLLAALSMSPHPPSEGGGLAGLILRAHSFRVAGRSASGDYYA